MTYEAIEFSPSDAPKNVLSPSTKMIFALAAETDRVNEETSGTIVVPNNFQSHLVIIPTERCASGSEKACFKAGASCGVVRDRKGMASEVYSWPSENNAKACISAVKNLKNRIQ